MKILVIEDELNIARVIQLYLEQANYTVLAARDARRARARKTA